MNDIILCDVDQVCADLTAEWLRRYNADWDDILTPEDITAWEIDRFVRPECGVQIYQYLKQPDLYDGVEQIEGAHECIQVLREGGWHVIFCTSSNPESAKAKMNWLDEHGFLDLAKPKHGRWSDVIVTSHKQICRGAVLIDDHVQNFGGTTARILFSQPHNAHYGPEPLIPGVGGLDRARDWDHVVEMLTDGSRVERPGVGSRSLSRTGL